MALELMELHIKTSACVVVKSGDSSRLPCQIIYTQEEKNGCLKEKMMRKVFD